MSIEKEKLMTFKVECLKQANVAIGAMYPVDFAKPDPTLADKKANKVMQLAKEMFDWVTSV